MELVGCREWDEESWVRNVGSGEDKEVERLG